MTRVLGVGRALAAAMARIDGAAAVRPALRLMSLPGNTLVGVPLTFRGGETSVLRGTPPG